MSSFLLKVIMLEIDEASMLKVLDYAKTRVESDILISKATYETFDASEIDILRQFKPTQDHTQLQQQIMHFSREKMM